MYEEVVKFGALIVDALNQYNQPIIIYIPPFAELRGGSWVVIDPTINIRQMEMYVDPKARGGILEPEGIVSIKLRMKDQKSLMERLDPEMKSLAEEFKCPDVTDEDKKAIELKMKKRAEILAPIYHQVAVQFADLHDTPARMKDKGVIRDIVEWSQSRSILYWRLRRRLLENHWIAEIKSLNPRLKDGQTAEMLRRWFIEDKGENQRFLWEQNKPVVEWLSQQKDAEHSVVRENLKSLKREAAMNEFKSLMDRNPDLLHEVGMHVVQRMAPEKREDFLDSIRNMRASDSGDGHVDPDLRSNETTDDSSENGES